MNPLLQSCSISLAEGICCTISDMNADHVMVTQETLVEHLVKNYPGITVPSHSILYNILGTLIKERKIYHTGEGYFIVTPNTYFFTNKATEDNRRVLLEDSCCCSAPSITYLVNIKQCANLVKENLPTVSCCRSCHCFPLQNMLREQRHWQLVNHEPKREGKKDCSELKPSTETQGICTSAENHAWDTIKSLTSMKAKLKSKRFGLGLFWRSFSKKEKHKKEYSTFSAQFPPREWPVRDEDDLDNIPRDIEHEIIKRINPTLTVDNLIKHTILMQKLEEQKKHISKEKKYVSNGTSAEVSVVRQNHLLKDCIQKAQSKTAKRTGKTKSKKEKQIGTSSRKSPIQELTCQNVQVEESLSLSVRNQEPPAVAVQSPVFYKKQITNPFQALPWRRSFYARGYRGVINSHLKSRARGQGRASHRPQPSASWRSSGYKTERLADRAKQNPPHAHRSCLQLQEDILSENGSCLQGSDLQIDNKSKYFLESNVSEENTYGRALKRSPGDIKKSPCFYTEHSGICKADAKLSICLRDERCRGKADAVGELLDRTANEFRNVHLSNYIANVNLVKKNGAKYMQNTDKKSELIFNYDCASHHRAVKLESEGVIDNCHIQNQKGHNGDTCNLLCLGDSSEGHEPCHPLPPGHAFSDTRDWSAAVSLKSYKVSNCPPQYNTTVNKCDSGDHDCKESGSFVESTDGLKEHPKPDSTEESWLCSQALLRGHREAEGTGLSECGKAPAVAGSRLAAEAHSDADTGHNFPPEGEGGGGVACCALGSQSKETGKPLGKKELVFKNTCSVISGQKHSEGTESHSITGDSGIDSPRWTEKKMKLPANF